MIDKINTFQKQHPQNVDLMVLNRRNELLYDSRLPHLDNVQEVIFKEEHRLLRPDEVITINMQLHKIEQNMRYRYDNDIYAPCKSEVDAAKMAVSDIDKLVRENYHGETLFNEANNNQAIMMKRASGFER